MSIEYDKSDCPILFPVEYCDRVAPLKPCAYENHGLGRPFFYPFETCRPIEFPQMDEPPPRREMASKLLSDVNPLFGFIPHRQTAEPSDGRIETGHADDQSPKNTARAGNADA